MSVNVLTELEEMYEKQKRRISLDAMQEHKIGKLFKTTNKEVETLLAILVKIDELRQQAKERA